jgi:hypothetical protein
MFGYMSQSSDAHEAVVSESWARSEAGSPDIECEAPARSLDSGPASAGSMLEARGSRGLRRGMTGEARFRAARERFE